MRDADAQRNPEMEEPSRDGWDGYRIACVAMLGAAALMGLYSALTLAGVFRKHCALLETTGRECVVCGCTRDFALLLTGHAPRWNPLSGPFFAIACAEILWRLIGVSVRRMPRAVVRADVAVHVVLIGWILMLSLRRIFNW